MISSHLGLHREAYSATAWTLAIRGVAAKHKKGNKVLYSNASLLKHTTPCEWMSDTFVDLCVRECLYACLYVHARACMHVLTSFLELVRNNEMRVGVKKFNCSESDHAGGNYLQFALM